jgi:hypothetical protein
MPQTAQTKQGHAAQFLSLPRVDVRFLLGRLAAGAVLRPDGSGAASGPVLVQMPGSATRVDRADVSQSRMRKDDLLWV